MKIRQLLVFITILFVSMFGFAGCPKKAEVSSTPEAAEGRRLHPRPEGRGGEARCEEARRARGRSGSEGKSGGRRAGAGSGSRGGSRPQTRLFRLR